MSKRPAPLLAPILTLALQLLATPAAATQDAARGLQLFEALECASCHGHRAEGGLGPTIAGTAKTLDQVLLQVRAPSSRKMPTFDVTKVSDEEVAAIYAYLQRLGPPTLHDKKTWWSVDLINLPTPATTPARDFEVHFSHRFSDSISDAGTEGFFGLDSFAFPSFWFSYGITDRIGAYLGRSANFATYEYGLKLGVLPEGRAALPLSVAVNVGGTYLDANGIPQAQRFTLEVPIGYRISDHIAAQMVPLYATHTDEFATIGSPGYSFALGFGASVKLSTRMALEGEWITNVDGFARPGSVDQWQTGIAIQAGRHLFQLMVSNGVFTTPDFMASGTFKTGIKSNVRFGFNLVRSFRF